jgi:hypothetical protein
LLQGLSGVLDEVGVGFDIVLGLVVDVGFSLSEHGLPGLSGTPTVVVGLGKGRVEVVEVEDSGSGLGQPLLQGGFSGVFDDVGAVLVLVVDVEDDLSFEQGLECVSGTFEEVLTSPPHFPQGGLLVGPGSAVVVSSFLLHGGLLEVVVFELVLRVELLEDGFEHLCFSGSCGELVELGLMVLLVLEELCLSHPHGSFPDPV